MSNHLSDQFLKYMLLKLLHSLVFCSSTELFNLFFIACGSKIEGIAIKILLLRPRLKVYILKQNVNQGCSMRDGTCGFSGLKIYDWTQHSEHSRHILNVYGSITLAVTL